MQENRWFYLRLVMGYVAVFLLIAIMMICFATVYLLSLTKMEKRF